VTNIVRVSEPVAAILLWLAIITVAAKAGG